MTESPPISRLCKFDPARMRVQKTIHAQNWRDATPMGTSLPELLAHFSSALSTRKMVRIGPAIDEGLKQQC